MSAVDARLCERIARSHTRTFYLASLFLPAEKRRGAFALYAFCRLADDMVDDLTRPDAQERLASYARALNDVFCGTPAHPVFRELAWTARTFELPRAPLDELLDGVSRDLEKRRYLTWRDLEEYCAGVASSVGEMCTHVFGVRGTTETLRRAVEHGRTLGTAMQLTNILRDIGEDARRGRVYLPEDELAAHGVSVTEILDGTALRQRDAWSALMRFQIDRARSLYGAASPGIALLQNDAQRCARACAMGYAGILDVIERNAFDSFTRRASLGWPARARVLVRCWLGVGHDDRRSVTPPADERAAVSTA